MTQARRILVTGAAGFIGAALCRHLVERADLQVVGLDNLCPYYDVELKYERLSMLGISRHHLAEGKAVESQVYPNFRFEWMSLENDGDIDRLFREGKFDYVVHLAAQAGVRYSITHPRNYIKSNIDGFINVLEGCRLYGVRHLVFASSSSVYGLNGKVPFSEHDSTEHPVSLYAATKKSDEMMAHAYASVFGLPVTGLRFFTVYGPWGRPDMSPYLFIDAILHNRPIKVFNHGEMQRDFTYIDDIVEGVSRIIEVIPEGNKDWDSSCPDPATSTAPYRIYNIGNSRPVGLMDYISEIEKALGCKAEKELLPMQPGDVHLTYADSSELAEATGFRPSTPLSEGIRQTVEWFKNYVLKHQL